MIPDEIISEIRERVDIVALIGEHITLKRRGASYVGVCPFHAEKTPSFHVNKARQFYHCFGCQESGDVVSFIMKFEGRTFPDAVRALAERAGVELTESTPAQESSSLRQKARSDRLYALMEMAAAFYQTQLRDNRGAGLAQGELRKRAIEPTTASVFRLGYAPDSWDSFEEFLRKKGGSLAEAEEVGLLVAKRERDHYYDRFRNRLMFPVSDIQGRVVAFSGRALGMGSDDRQEPKYLNSPESPLFSKGAILFGIHQARVDIRRKGYAVLCEGNFDLLALHQAGFTNAVAPLGTAFTETQAKLLRRFTERVILMFDSDTAGHKAVGAAHLLLAAVGISARVVDLPAGHDPDSYLRDKGREALQQLVDSAPGGVEFLIDLTANATSRVAADVGSAIARLAPLIAAIESPVERHKYIEHIAKRFEIRNLQVVRKELNRGLRDHRSQRNPKSADVSIAKSMTSKEKDHPRLPPLECELVGAFLDFPELFSNLQQESFVELLTNQQLRFIFEKARGLVKEKGDYDAHILISEIEPEIGESRTFKWLKERLAVQKFQSVHEAKGALESGIRQLRKGSIERKFRSLAAMISEARRKGDDQLALELSMQQVALTRDAASVVHGLKR